MATNIKENGPFCIISRLITRHQGLSISLQSLQGGGTSVCAEFTIYPVTSPVITSINPDFVSHEPEVVVLRSLYISKKILNLQLFFKRRWTMLVNQ